MATEEQKKANQLRLAKLSLLGLAASVWDMVGDGAYAFSKGMGEHILPVLEKEMGLELTGESLVDIVTEVGRIAVDEFGFAESVEVSGDDNVITLKVKNCANRKLTDDLMATGVEHPFICPFLCVGEAILHRAGKRARGTVEKWVEGNGSIITFELI